VQEGTVLYMGGETLAVFENEREREEGYSTTK
jgi:hypothetical protein